MVERNNYEGFNEKISLSKIKLAGIPIGRILDITSKLGSDKETLEGLSKAKEVLKEKGLIILDVHHTRFDSLATGLNLFRELDIEKFVIPSSIKNLKHPILKYYYAELRKIKGFEIFPTYRMADYVSDDEKRLYKDMPEEERKMRNQTYIDRALEILNKPNSLVFVAVYGGFNKPNKKGIPHGIESIIKTGNPALCTLSVYKKSFFSMKTYVSEDLLNFENTSSNNDMYKTIMKEHRKIAERANFNPDYFNYVNKEITSPE